MHQNKRIPSVCFLVGDWSLHNFDLYYVQIINTAYIPSKKYMNDYYFSPSKLNGLTM